jgi:type I restriction enzyme S subunit
VSTTLERVRIGDVLFLERRSVVVEPDEHYEEIGIRSFGRGIFHKDPVSGAALGKKRLFRIEPGDLVISNVFAWEGAIAKASEAEAGKVGSHRFMTFVPRDTKIDPAWAAWFFQSEPGIELIGRASPGSAGRNRTLAIKRFEALEIPLPSIEEQLRTTAHLESVRRSARSMSERFARNEAGALAAMLPGCVDALIRASTQGYARVDELVDFVSDIVHPGEDPSPAEEFVGLQHIESHTGRQIGSDPLGPMKGRKFRFQPGDVIYGYLRPYLNKVWVANRHGLCSVDQYVLRPRRGVSPALFAHSLRGRKVLTAAIELTHSLQLPRLRSGLLASLEVPTVNESDAADVAARLDVMRDQVVAIAARRETQIKLASSLVPAALNEAFGSR